MHCVRNITLCPHCDDPVAKSDLEHHIAEQHTKATCPHCSAVLQKSEVDKHIADAHSTEPCPECGDNISRNLLEDHMQSVHSTTDCPLCRRVVNKTDLPQHQVSVLLVYFYFSHFIDTLYIASFQLAVARAVFCQSLLLYLYR